MLDRVFRGLTWSDGWITRRRVGIYAVTWLVLSSVLWIVWLGLGRGGMDLKGTVAGSDFLGFYSASVLVAEGRAVDAYDPVVFHAVQKSVAGADVELLTWPYPPPAFFLVGLWACLPYGMALALWLGLSGAFYIGALSRIGQIGHDRLLPWTLAAFPAFFLNWTHGQNGAWNTGWLALGAAWMTRYPVWAGLSWSCLVYKPQIVLPLLGVLVLARRWRVLVAWGCGAVLWVGMSGVIWGIGSWEGWRGMMVQTVEWMEKGLLTFEKIPTTYAALRLAGVGHGWAQMGQGLFLLGAGWMVRRVRWKDLDGWGCAALAVPGIFLLSPYAWDYDLLLLALPLVWLGREALVTGWRPGEKTALLALALFPLLVSPVAHLTRLQVAPLVMIFLLMWITRRQPGRVRPVA